ncbi:unnamed protein product [Protopolystoma xenopodis]|uniref:Uncharacterized protein n=1 Tax=Protopolystoma xenopodis TaxID=117903 RepID=A0A3S5CHF7_9PLAT|nr:unnamed protein product [Protopolystoma xenopodis]
MLRTIRQLSRRRNPPSVSDETTSRILSDQLLLRSEQTCHNNTSCLLCPRPLPLNLLIRLRPIPIFFMGLLYFCLTDFTRFQCKYMFYFRPLEVHTPSPHMPERLGSDSHACRCQALTPRLISFIKPMYTEQIVNAYLCSPAAHEEEF